MLIHASMIRLSYSRWLNCYNPIYNPTNELTFVCTQFKILMYGQKSMEGKMSPWTDRLNLSRADTIMKGIG